MAMHETRKLASASFCDIIALLQLLSYYSFFLPKHVSLCVLGIVSHKHSAGSLSLLSSTGMKFKPQVFLVNSVTYLPAIQ